MARPVPSIARIEDTAHHVAVTPIGTFEIIGRHLTRRQSIFYLKFEGVRLGHVDSLEEAKEELVEIYDWFCSMTTEELDTKMRLLAKKEARETRVHPIDPVTTKVRATPVRFGPKGTLEYA